MFLTCQAFILACHPSKDPIFFLYSSSKFSAILVLSAVALIIFYYSSFYTQNNSERKKEIPAQFFGIESPFFIAVSILLLSYLFNLNTSFSTGVDFATQLKATLQWNEGLTDKWNHLIHTVLNLNLNETDTWLFRPPGAILYYLPFIQLPLPLGESLRFAQLTLCIIICICWLKIAKILHFERNLQILLAVILALWVANDLSYAGNVQLLATAYSALFSLLALQFAHKVRSSELLLFKNILCVILLSLCLGAVVFIKASAVIYNCAIFVSIFVVLYFRKFKKANLSYIFIPTLLFFCIPYFILKIINAANGVDLDNVYKQDYNNQWLTQELWGDYFTQTTEFPAVFLSLAASFSTFSPFNLAQTLVSNLLTYMGILDEFILSFHLNPKVIYKASVGSLFSLVLGFYFLQNSCLSRKLLCALALALFFPFAIFAYLSNQHGYNYLITGTYNQQYIPLYCVLILLTSFNLLKKDNRKANLLAAPIIFFSLGLFSFSNTTSLLGNFKNPFESRSLSSEHIGHPFFGTNIKMVDDVILEHRKSTDCPIIYLANSSIEEICIAYKGRYTGVSNISKLLRDKQFSFPIFSNKAIIVIDARLNDDELASIHSMISERRHSYLLNLPETSKVISIEG